MLLQLEDLELTVELCSSKPVGKKELGDENVELRYQIFGNENGTVRITLVNQP